MLYIYLHDLNSGYIPDSTRVLGLSELGDITGITYDTFTSYDDIYRYLTSQVPNDRNDIVFIGTGLGGFWAAQMGKHFGVPSVSINPCNDPYSMLRGYQDIISTNYHSGVTNVLTSSIIDTYAGKNIRVDDQAFRYLPLLLLDDNEEARNYVTTLKDLNKFKLRVNFFKHTTNINEYVREYLNHCEYVERLDT